MIDLEVELDRFLKIKTNGRDDSHSNHINYPYEATPYCVLQVLANSGYISKKDKIIDFGSGKGRVSFYLAFATKAKMVGVEYDQRLYNSAIENHKKCISSHRVEFINCNAKDYMIPEDVCGLYFFNPFSVEILTDVMKNLIESKIKKERDVYLFFYYPSKEYLEFLNGKTNITLVDKIDCSELFSEFNEREYIAVYKI